ncbi:MAG: PEP-CTERM sorting domain-containing protein, partial [Verrucomicrobiales bacterium]|nr:PEP-CTERM sorting domain-containing protein [Verrucomicrobiales bacterium]
ADLDAKAGQAINGTTGVITATDYTPLGDSSAIIENASATPGILRITQNTDATWDAYFRDGIPSGPVGENCMATPGSLSLEKLGTGKAVLSVFNDYTGTTTVTDGELQVGTAGDGSWDTYTQGATTITTTSGFGQSGAAGSTGTGDTIVAGGALSGSGHIRGNTIVNAGMLAPGDSSGTFGPGGSTGTLYIGSNDVSSSNPVGNLTFNGGTTKMQLALATDYYPSLDDGTYYIEQGASYQSYIADIPNYFAGTAVSPNYFGEPGVFVQDTQHDHITVGGDVLWNGGNIVVDALDMGYFPAAGDVFNLIDWFGLGTNWGAFNVGSSNYLVGNGDDNGNLDLPDLSGIDPALRWDTSLFTSHGIIVVALSPEPSRMVLLIGGLGIVFLRRRRTNRVG